jgi:hypothetical protein
MLTIAVMAGAGSLALPGSAGLATAATATGSTQLREVSPIAQMTHLAISRNPFPGPFKIVNVDMAGSHPPYCLDANSAGPTAGKNGDKVQLWHCNGRKNQLWHAGGYDRNNDYMLFNEAYPSECLNADDAGGLRPGRHVQLWRCTATTPNAYWNVLGWAGCTSDGSACALPLVAGGRYILDAIPTAVNNGDWAQISTYNGRNPEQGWHS